MNEKATHSNSTHSSSEEWWASVLAEESKYVGVKPAGAGETKPKVKQEAPPSSAEKPAVDWNHARDLYNRDQIIEVLITGWNRGGLLAEGEGVAGFVPFSHLIDLTGTPENALKEINAEGYVAKTLRVKVIECAEAESRVVFSERAAQAESGMRAQLFDSLAAGQCVEGTVTNLTDFGVFVDLGGVEGLIHISELSWGRVSHPNQVVKVNDRVAVKILELAPARCRVALSLKQLQPNPWSNAAQVFPAGSILPATITSILHFGAFAKLDANVEGLIHSSEIPQAEGKNLSEILTVGARVNVRVLHVEPSQQRLGLSMKLEG